MKTATLNQIEVLPHYRTSSCYPSKTLKPHSLFPKNQVLFSPKLQFLTPQIKSFCFSPRKLRIKAFNASSSSSASQGSSSDENESAEQLFEVCILIFSIKSLYGFLLAFWNHGAFLFFLFFFFWILGSKRMKSQWLLKNYLVPIG